MIRTIMFLVALLTLTGCSDYITKQSDMAETDEPITAQKLRMFENADTLAKHINYGRIDLDEEYLEVHVWNDIGPIFYPFELNSFFRIYEPSSIVFNFLVIDDANGITFEVDNCYIDIDHQEVIFDGGSIIYSFGDVPELLLEPIYNGMQPYKKDKE